MECTLANFVNESRCYWSFMLSRAWLSNLYSCPGWRHVKLFFSLLAIRGRYFIGNVRGNIWRVNWNVFEAIRSIELDPPLAIDKSNLFLAIKFHSRDNKLESLRFNNMNTLINFIIEREAIQSDPYQRLQTSTRCLNRSKITSQELDQACRVWKHM